VIYQINGDFFGKIPNGIGPTQVMESTKYSLFVTVSVINSYTRA